MIALDISNITLKLRQEEDKTLVFDPVRRRWLVLTPEEHLRQYVLHILTGKMNYPAALLAVEKAISVSGITKRFDIVVYDRNHKPWMLVECKRPEVAITEQVLHQLLAYQNAIKSRYWLLTNGHQTYCADAIDVNNIHWLTSFPPYPF